MPKAWVGIDLDGTLAEYDEWRGPEHIGKPIPAMVAYVKGLIRSGVQVKIFTARVCSLRLLENEEEVNQVVTAVNKWCKKHIGQVLEITAEKDFDMVFCVDDRAVSVEKNTGEFLVSPPSVSSIRWHNDADNPENPDAQADGSGE